MIEKLFENIGGKIKMFVKIVFIIEVILILGSGLTLFFLIPIIAVETENINLLWGLLIIPILTFISLFVAYLGTWLIYAYGDLVDNSNKTRLHTLIMIKKMGFSEEIDYRQ